MVEQCLQSVLASTVIGSTIGIYETKFVGGERIIAIRQKKNRADLQSISDLLDLSGLQVYVSFFVFGDGSTLNTNAASKFLSGQTEFFTTSSDFFPNIHIQGPPFPKLIVTEKFYYYKKKFLTRNKARVYYVSSQETNLIAREVKTVNSLEMKVAMKRNEDTQEKLAEALGLQISGISARINGHIDFRISEVEKIRDRYNLSNEDLVNIFFTTKVS